MGKQPAGERLHQRQQWPQAEAHAAVSNWPATAHPSPAIIASSNPQTVSDITTVEDRCRGVLLGLAAGDRNGGPVVRDKE
jgi:hypothetical protein